MSWTVRYVGLSPLDYVDSTQAAMQELRDMEPFLRTLEQDWAQSRVDIFRTKGQGQWPDYLASEARYVAYKDALRAGRKLLQFDAGRNAKRLYKSLTLTNHPEFIFVVSPNAIRMGTSVPYGAKHLSGGSTPKWGGVRYPIRNYLLNGSFDSLVDKKLEVYTQRIADMATGN